MLVSVLSIAISGCQRSEKLIAVSQASIENVQVNETLDNEAGRHLINVSFDFRITPFLDGKDTYFCTVQFVHKELGKSFTSLSLEDSPCAINAAQGTMDVNWLGPLDNGSLNTLNANLLRLPVQYFVAIHQYTKKPESIIIARSKTMKSTISSKPEGASTQ